MNVPIFFISLLYAVAILGQCQAEDETTTDNVGGRSAANSTLESTVDAQNETTSTFDFSSTQESNETAKFTPLIAGLFGFQEVATTGPTTENGVNESALPDSDLLANDTSVQGDLNNTNPTLLDSGDEKLNTTVSSEIQTTPAAEITNDKIDGPPTPPPFPVNSVDNSVADNNFPNEVYVKTSGVPKTCVFHLDCYDMREPNEWCPFKEGERYLDKGCFCDHARSLCKIQRSTQNGIQYTDCADKSTSACANFGNAIQKSL